MHSLCVETMGECGIGEKRFLGWVLCVWRWSLPVSRKVSLTPLLHTVF